MRILFRILLILLVLISWRSEIVLGQRYYTRTYTEADGLANSMIFDMVQDTSGLLWIARRSGISSYNGTNFSNYNVNDGLWSTSYAFLTIDAKEKLWALPESGALFLSRLEGGKWVNIFPMREVMLNSWTTYSSLDVFNKNKEDVILVGTVDKGVFIYQDNRWKQYTCEGGLPSNQISAVRHYAGNIYIASEKGLTMLQEGDAPPLPVEGSPLFTSPVLAMERQNDKLWILGERWLGYLQKGRFNLVTDHFYLPFSGQERHYFLHPGKNDQIYFGNAHNVFHFSLINQQVELLDRHNGLITDGGTSVLVDREMNTWITGYRGITKIPSERFAGFSENDGLFSNEVASAMEIEPGRYVFGHDCALTFYDGSTMKPFRLDPHKANVNLETRVLDIKKGTHGAIWLAVSSLGLARLDQNKQIAWYREEQGLQGIAYTIAMGSSGTIYAGTSAGLFEFDHGRFRILDLGHEFNHSIRKIFIGTDANLYLATMSSGLIIRMGKNLISCKSADNPLANNIYAFLMDSGNKKWVGTAAGLYELEGHELKRVNRDGLVVNRPVYVILEDHDGNLWFGTDNGVYRWKHGRLEHFTATDGLAGQDVNRAAGFVDSKHHIWFGTNNGISVFKPELDYDAGAIPPPKISLRFVCAGNDTLNPKRKQVFPYDINDLSFHVRVISLINERQICIKYYLEGADEGWSNEIPYNYDRFVYNNLRPGTYRFFIKARNALGTWSDPVCSASFTIRQPFWFRGWFLSLTALLFFSLVFILARFILVNRFKNRLKAEVNQRTMELRKSEKLLMASNAAKDTFFSIIAHDLRNPFNVILGYLDLLTLEDSDYSEAEQKRILFKLKSAAVRTIELLENLLTWARTQRGTLPFDPEPVAIDDIIAGNLDLFETAALSKEITLITRGQKDLWAFVDKNMINTVVRNLISNAIKFSFPGGTITIAAETEQPDSILISIMDKGMGIAPEIMEDLFKIEKHTVVRGTANETGTGLGLVLCKEFVVRNQGTLNFSSEQGAGSTFSFSLPRYQPLYVSSLSTQ